MKTKNTNKERMKKDTKNDLKFDTADMLTKKDTGKPVIITTILNMQIHGIIIKNSPYQIEQDLIIFSNQYNIIIS